MALAASLAFCIYCGHTALAASGLSPDATSAKEKVGSMSENRSAAGAIATDVQSRTVRAAIGEYLQIGFVAFVIVFGFIRPFIAEPYKIPSGSMEDTLLVGDRVLVIKFLYGVKLPGTSRRLFAFRKPQRGDVFVFSPKHDPRTHFIKRVVAVEGDTVETRGHSLLVNGKPLVGESYVKHLAGSLPDFPPFHYPLVPYFHESPTVTPFTQGFGAHIPVHDVQLGDGVPIAFRVGDEPQFLVRHVRERRKSLPPGDAGVNEYFTVDAESEMGSLLIRVVLYQKALTGEWFLSDRIEREEFARRNGEDAPFTVPPGHFFGMGDNRENSADSRAWGPVPFDVVKGKAILVYWSSNGDPGVPFLKRFRWSRIGRFIRAQYGDGSW